jgi:sulfoxide reductase heme-binding subunit YedZ
MLRRRWTTVVVFLLCTAPAAWLGWRLWRQDLGPNPLETLQHFTGDWAIRFLIIALAVTPFRKLLRQPDLIRFRRMLGLTAFYYGCLHFLVYLWFDKLFDTQEIVKDIAKRPFITMGFSCLMLMLPLAITSTKGWIRRLGGKRWQLLHRLVYLSAIAAVVHYYWLVKSDIRLPVFYGSLVALLLGTRLFWSFRKTTARPAAAPTKVRATSF